MKVGSNITVSYGTISLTKANVTNALGYTPPTTNTVYSLPNATSTTLGGVKIGSNISVSSGTISLSSSNITNALGYTPAKTDAIKYRIISPMYICMQIMVVLLIFVIRKSVLLCLLRLVMLRLMKLSKQI